MFLAFLAFLAFPENTHAHFVLRISRERWNRLWLRITLFREVYECVVAITWPAINYYAARALADVKSARQSGANERDSGTSVGDPTAIHPPTCALTTCWRLLTRELVACERVSIGTGTRYHVRLLLKNVTVGIVITSVQIHRPGRVTRGKIALSLSSRTSWPQSTVGHWYIRL